MANISSLLLPHRQLYRMAVPERNWVQKSNSKPKEAINLIFRFVAFPFISAALSRLRNLTSRCVVLTTIIPDHPKIPRKLPP